MTEGEAMAHGRAADAAAGTGAAREQGNAPPADSCRPVDLRLDRVDGLWIQWSDGQTHHYPLAYLRKHCPCATCRTQRPDDQPIARGLSLPVLPAGIERASEFAGARMVGNYAIQITWKDGHSTGIYDFRYLREIAPGARGSGQAAMNR
jgi:DUF971 family protein